MIAGFPIEFFLFASVLAGVAVLLVLWRPRRAVQWMQYGWMGWQVARKLRSNWSQNKTAP